MICPCAKLQRILKTTNVLSNIEGESIPSTHGARPELRPGEFVSISELAVHTCKDRLGKHLFPEFQRDTPYLIMDVVHHPGLDVYLYRLAPNGSDHFYYCIEDAFEVYTAEAPVVN